MINEDKKNPSQQDQLSVKSAQYENIPQNVIYSVARFNKEFLNSQIGGRPVTVSIGTMLTVMGEQDNTIRGPSRILGRDYNEQHLHDMHNLLFGDPAIGGHSIGREGMNMGNLLNQLTTFIHQQNQQIQTLIEEIRKNVKQINDQMQSSS